MVHIASSSLVLKGPVPPPAARGGRKRGILAAAAATSISLWAVQQQRPPALGSFGPKVNARRKPKVSWLAVDALSGAIGEVASLVILYPLDSLKVLCQARGSSTTAVLAELKALNSGPLVLRQLYAGCGSAALCSAAIGAIYLLTFYSAKRLGAAALGASAPAAAAAQQPGGHQQQVRQQPGKSGSGKADGGGGAGSGGSQLADGSGAHPPLNSEGTHPLVASLAGVVASLAGSIFEAPMEMFKLRTQAGALEGPMLSTMLRAASTGGLGSLYATYGAFMLKSIPYDVAELATYSQMCDLREAAAAARLHGGGAASSSSGGGQQQQQRWQVKLGLALADMPTSMSDMLIGAAAGAASVLVSMPCDVIKTRMDLFPPQCMPGSRSSGVLCSTRAFIDTGRQLMAKGGGPQALFVGVAPRMLQTVPSTMVYWAAVEGTRRFMQQHFDVDRAPEASSSSGAASSTSQASWATGSSGGDSSRIDTIGSGIVLPMPAAALA